MGNGEEVIHVCYSNRLEALARSFVIDRAQHRVNAGDDIFSADQAIVENGQISTYLKTSIARDYGICAGIEFVSFHAFLAEHLRSIHVGLLGTRELHCLIGSLLAEPDLLARSSMAPVRAYLGVGGDDDALAKRRYQLAGEIAHRFSGYCDSRPELLSTWKSRHLFGNSDWFETEAWQREIWLGLHKPKGLLQQIQERTGVQWMTLPMLCDLAPSDWTCPTRIYVIGVSGLQSVSYRILQQLAQRVEVHVYALNPCREYWEDIHTGAESISALKLWGSVASKRVRALSELCNHNFRECFVDSPGQSKLQQLQHNILVRETESRTHLRNGEEPQVQGGASTADQAPRIGIRELWNTGTTPQIGARSIFEMGSRPMTSGGDDDDDNTVLVLGCPDVRRELEIVSEQIWRLMIEDETLRFNDIAVRISPAEYDTYITQIPSVFGEFHSIPHHLVNVPVCEESRVVEALLHILALPFSGFTRPALLRIMTHPCVMARWGQLNDADWIRFSQELGIVHGADHKDHDQTYIERDLFNWDQGLRRLALGAFLSSDSEMGARAIDFGGTSYVPLELSPDQLASAARFVALARALIEDGRECLMRQRPLHQWARVIDRMIAKYLSTCMQADENHLPRCREVIASLSDIDLDNRAISYREAYEFAQRALSELTTNRGEFLADGVTIAPLSVSVAAIPFRAVFAVGLNEDSFPRQDSRGALDLRAAKPSPLDISQRDRDRDAFLDMLLAARERLCLSFVSRDPYTGESRQPSVVVAELQYLLRKFLGVDCSTVQYPLRRYAERDFEGEAVLAPPSGISPIARQQSIAAALRADLAGHLAASGIREMPSPAKIQQHISEMAADRLRVALKISPLPSPPQDREQDQDIGLSFANLRRFLETPVQAWASYVLNLREATLENPSTIEDEPFHLSALDDTQMLREVFVGYLCGEDSEPKALWARYSRSSDSQEWSGHLPTGTFGQHVRSRHRLILNGWLAHIDMLREQGQISRWSNWSNYGFGYPMLAGSKGQWEPPLTLQSIVNQIDLRLVGRTELLGESGIGSLILIANDTIQPKHVLRGMIDQLVLASAGMASNQPHRVTILSAGQAIEQYQLAPWSQRDAARYLSELATDLLTGDHAYLLPCEAIFAYQRNKNRSLQQTIEALRKQKYGMSCLYGPVVHADRLPVPEQLLHIVERRFQCLLDRMRRLEGGGA